MNTHRFILLVVLSLCMRMHAADTYTNPILYADYSDPDVIRVENEYWMTASSFNCSPGLPVMHSYNLVDWEIVGYALPHAIPGGVGGSCVEHGNQVWAPSIRYHNGIYYIMWGDPDSGIWQVHTSNPRGRWSEPVCVCQAKGFIDACPFWDDNGQTYIAHALAGSRAGLKSVLLLCEADEELTRVISPSQIIFDGHLTQPTCEGAKLYKKDGFYYLFFPAGGVATGWQTVIRSRTLYSDWTEKIVMHQGNTDVNGPHQGGWVTTPSGEDWFIHFQDVGPLGRILHLQPMQWQADGWPIIGLDNDGDGIGEPVYQYRMPDVGKAKMPTVEDIDHALLTTEKTSPTALGPAWQWQAQPEPTWLGFHQQKLRLYSVPQKGLSLWQQPNLLLRKINGPDETRVAELLFHPTDKYTGERCGLLVFGTSYAGLMMENTPEGIRLYIAECIKAEKGAAERTIPLEWNPQDTHLFIRLRIVSHEPQNTANTTDKSVKATFDYRTQKGAWKKSGYTFDVQPGKWIGAKTGFFITRPNISINDGGWVEILSYTQP